MSDQKDGEGSEKTKQLAKNYLTQHKIVPLFEKLCVELVYNKPANPREFLIKELELIQKQDQSKRNDVKLFTDEDLDTLFNMFNPVGAQQLHAEQAANALRMLGVPDTVIAARVQKDDKLSKQDFTRIARAAIADI